MGKLTGTRHGDAANNLFAFYGDKVGELEKAGQYFMAAIALGFALETAILTYLLVEFGEDDGTGELEIPDSADMGQLIEAANEIDVLNAPINISVTHSGGQHAPKICRQRCRRQDQKVPEFDPPSAGAEGRL